MRKKVIWLLTGLILIFGAFSGIFSFFGQGDLMEKEPRLLVDGSEPVFCCLSADVFPVSEKTFLILSQDLCLSKEDIQSKDMDISSPSQEFLAASSEDHSVPLREDGNVSRIAIVIDDFGYSSSMAEEIAGLSIHVTWAIIPYIRGTARAVSLAENNNVPYLVHIPMQAFSDERGGPYLIGEGMSSGDIQEQVGRIMKDFPGAVGINNHRGSKATSDRDIMEAFMSGLSGRGLIFLDSRTSGSSVAYDVAREKGIPALVNNIFLDNSKDPEEIASVFAKALKRARKEGRLVAICHVRPGTLKFLKDLCTKDIDGVEFVTVPEMLKARQGR
jgi:hypothetical protein